MQDLLETHRAPTVEQRVPGVDHAGQAAGEQAVAFRNLAAIIFFVPLDGREFGGARLRVDGVDLVFAGAIDEKNRVAADAVVSEVRDRQRGLAADGGVEGIAASFKNLARDFGGFGFHRSDRGVAPPDDRAHGLAGVGDLGERSGNDREK